MEPRTALVTGASSGIGRVFAQRLAQEGYHVTCVARSEGKLMELAEELGQGHRVLAADLTDSQQLDAVAKDIEQHKYSLLINNAGYGLYDRFENIPLEKHENLMYLNMTALMRLSYVYLKNASKGDALINVSSALSRLSYPGGAVYCGTKGFVTNFTESLWYEYKDKGIYVMALLPGVTKTNFHNVALGKAVEASAGGAYTPEVVVEEGLKALKKRKKPSLVSGRRFRFLTGLSTRLMGRKKMISIMGKRNLALN